MTPHFGGGTEHAQRRMTSLVRQNLDNHFAGKPVASPLPELREKVLVELRGTAGCTHLNDALRALAEVPVLVHRLRA